MYDRSAAPDEILEVAPKVAAANGDAIQDVAEGLHLEQVAICRGSGAQGRANATVVHDADVTLPFDAHRIGDEVTQRDLLLGAGCGLLHVLGNASDWPI